MTILPADLRAENAEAPWTDEKVAKIINTSVKRIDDLAAENATLRATLARYQTAEAAALMAECRSEYLLRGDRLFTDRLSAGLRQAIFAFGRQLIASEGEA